MTPDPESDPERPKPDWWDENEHLRQQMELPSYAPPRFEDGVYYYEVRDPLEEAHGCTIRVMGENTKYPDDLEVRIDGETAFMIPRYRNENGNTVFEMTAEEFREAIERALDGA